MVQDSGNDPFGTDRGDEGASTAPEQPWPAELGSHVSDSGGAQPWSPADMPPDQSAAQPAPAWPPSQTPGWPPSQTPGWPPAQAPGWPPSQAQAPGWPPGQAQAPGWPPAQAQAPGWPPGQAPGWPPAQAPGWPPGQAPGWPPSAPYGYQQPAAGMAQQASPWTHVQFGPAPGLIWGDVGVRVGAMVIDMVVYLGALIVAALAAEAFGVQHHGSTQVLSAGARACYIVWWIFAVAYFPTSWWAFQGTLGQRLLRLKIVRGRDGGPIGVGETTIRFLLFAVCMGFFLIPAIIAAVLAADNPARRTWWDDAAGTMVVRKV